MALRFFRTIDITAGQQFLGTELGTAPSKANRRLIVRELLIAKGAENANVRVVKQVTQGGGLVNYDIIAPVTSVATFVALGPTSLLPGDRVTDLFPGEQIQIISTGATVAMHARVQYEDAPNDLEPPLKDAVLHFPR